MQTQQLVGIVRKPTNVVRQTAIAAALRKAVVRKGMYQQPKAAKPTEPKR